MLIIRCVCVFLVFVLRTWVFLEEEADRIVFVNEEGVYEGIA